MIQKLDNKIPIKFKSPLNDWRARLVLIIFSLILSSIIIGTLSLSHFLNYFKNTNDCRNSYEITNDQSSLKKMEQTELKEKIAQAYNLCPANHQAQAYRIAYVATSKEEVKKYFEEVDIGKFNPSKIEDRGAANLMYFRRIQVEEDDLKKIEIMNDSVKFEVDPCSKRIEIIKAYTNLQNYEKAKEVIDFYKSTPYAEGYTCLQVDLGEYPGSPLLDKEDYFDFLLAEYNAELLVKKENELTDLYSKIQELAESSTFNKRKLESYEKDK